MEHISLGAAIYRMRRDLAHLMFHEWAQMEWPWLSTLHAYKLGSENSGEIEMRTRLSVANRTYTNENTND